MIVEILLITGATLIGLFFVYLLLGGLFGGPVGVEEEKYSEWRPPLESDDKKE